MTIPIWDIKDPRGINVSRPGIFLHGKPPQTFIAHNVDQCGPQMHAIQALPYNNLHTNHIHLLDSWARISAGQY